MIHSFTGCLAAASLLIPAVLAAALGGLGAVLAAAPHILLDGLYYACAALCIGTAVWITCSLLYALTCNKKGPVAK